MAHIDQGQSDAVIPCFFSYLFLQIMKNEQMPVFFCFKGAVLRLHILQQELPFLEFSLPMCFLVTGGNVNQIQNIH